jgi:hypothetical protein
MNANVYNLFGIDISGTFQRIDCFLEDNFVDLINKKIVLNEINVKKIKILISDLYSLQGLIPEELKLREHLMFKLSLILNMHYISNNEEVNLIENFFLIPKNGKNDSNNSNQEIKVDTDISEIQFNDPFGTDSCRI